MVDAADEKEHGLFGLDLVRSMELRGPRAIVTHAASDGEAESYSSRSRLSAFGRDINQLKALTEIRTCGCEAALKGVR